MNNRIAFLFKEFVKVSKKIVILMFLWSSVRAVSADLIIDKNDSHVSDVNVEVLLETAPVNAQKELLSHKSQLKKQLEQLYLKQLLAKMAKDEGLDKEPMNAARLQAIMDNALFLLKLDNKRKSNKKDYSKFAKQLYTIKKSNYKTVERVDAAHILIATKELPEEKALEKIKEIRKELIAGADFSEVALRVSQDKSVQQNKGEMGAFTKKQMVKPFSDAAFSLEPGDLSEPIKTRFGYHLIKVNKKIPAGIKSFDEVKEGIIAKLEADDWETDREEYYKKIKKENKMEIDEEALDAFIVKKLAELENK
ncbi:MAG: peptidylprolyl isomerase [Methylococcales bacterium]|nr:peptidylprolyl isomerase [Methylococcales bacterium]